MCRWVKGGWVPVDLRRIFASMLIVSLALVGVGVFMWMIITAGQAMKSDGNDQGCVCAQEEKQ